MAISLVNNLSMNRSDTAVADQVWTATSATLSDFQAAASSDYVKIQTTTLGVATTPWTIDGWIDDTVYKNYVIYIYNLQTADGGAWIEGRWNIAGSPHTSSDYTYTFAQAHSGGSIDSTYSTSATVFRICTSSNPSESEKRLTATITLYDPTNTNFYHGHTQTVFGYDNTTNFIGAAGGGTLKLTTALTGISFISSSGGNIIADSTVTIYGIKA